MSDKKSNQPLLNKIKENKLALERLKSETSRLLDEFGISLEMSQTFLDNPDHFSPNVWDELQNEKKLLEDQLQQDMKNIKDPEKLKQTFSERAQVQQHWLFVR